MCPMGEKQEKGMQALLVVLKKDGGAPGAEGELGGQGRSNQMDPSRVPGGRGNGSCSGTRGGLGWTVDAVPGFGLGCAVEIRNQYTLHSCCNHDGTYCSLQMESGSQGEWWHQVLLTDGTLLNMSRPVYLGSPRSSDRLLVPEGTRGNIKADWADLQHHHDQFSIWQPQFSGIRGGDARRPSATDSSP